MHPGITPPGHQIPRHISVVNHSTKAADEDVAFWVAAVDKHLRETVAPLWDGEAPGVSFYGRAARIPVTEAAIVGIVDDDGNAESAGYHAKVGPLAYSLIDMSQSRMPSVTLDHEVGELYANMSLDRKVPGPGGRLYYVEPWDPVQRQQKDIAVTLFGQTRLVPVGDFALPRWYGLVNVDPGDLRMTWLDQELKAFEPATGGYQIADESDGRSVFLCQGEADVNGSRHSRSRRIVERRAR